MYTIKKCSEVSDFLIFKAFTDGFADYIIHVEMDEAFFIDRFFGPEGNDRALSYIAFKEDKPVGVTLGGLKMGENFKTLRCGGMSLIPEERGTGLAKTLMDFHEKAAIDMGCSQLFLEVIDSNERAIKFYQKLGYEKVYDLTYRTWKLEGKNPLFMDENALLNEIEVMTYDAIHELRMIDHSHLPWQGDFAYFKELPCHYYGIKDKDGLVAGCVATSNRLIYLWVKPEKRQKGYAKALLNKILVDLKPEALRIAYANNAEIHTFANHYKMLNDPIGQLEMYKWLA